MPVEICVPHHDIAILPNENILAICEETKTQQEAQNAGLQGINGPMTLDMVVEIQPLPNNQAEIVWLAENLITLEEQKAISLIKLLETLDNCEILLLNYLSLKKKEC